MPTVFTVDPRSGVPIYMQLVEQVKRSIALGVLSPGEQLPTVKQLALDLTVNPNTVARAYRDLERDGVIETSPGRGSFVADNGAVGLAAATVHEVAAVAFERAAREAKSMGLTRQDVERVARDAVARWYEEAGPAGSDER